MRLVIGEDSALFREGLARLLVDAGHEIVAKAANADALLAAVRATSPDVALIDIRMPPDFTDDGARAARQLRAEFPELGVVLLSQHIETHHSVQLVATGGFGYLLKDRVLDVDDFLDALRRVAAGKRPRSGSRSSAPRTRTTRRPAQHSHPTGERGLGLYGRRPNQRRHRAQALAD